MHQYSTEAAGAQRAGDAAPEAAPRIDPIYANRELSWLAFNRRVLQEAASHDNPLLERARFLSITASNLDEFFMVRFASLDTKAQRGDESPDPAGMTAKQQMEHITEDARAFMEEQLTLFDVALRPALAEAGLRIWRVSELGTDQRRWMRERFQADILPLAAPYVQAQGAPFPQVVGRALQLGMLLRGGHDGDGLLATMQAPHGMPRLWAFPEGMGGGFCLLEDIICLHAAQLLPGHDVLGCWPYRVTRDEDYTVSQDSDIKDLVSETRKSLKKRKSGAVMRLELDSGADPLFVRLLREALGMRSAAVYRIAGPLDFTFLAKGLGALPGMQAHRYPPFAGRMPAGMEGHPTVFAALRAGDIFLHHPYDSFDAVLRFVREAASDARVLAINMTLYRVSGQSPVIRALCEAAEAGKRVTVLLEIKARFDEENNMHWAEVLRKAGCEVLYGVERLKTHSKITLVVRREDDGLRRYLHLGTGNYNDVTARQYTDMGLMTCDGALGEDAQAFFNMITGFSREPGMHKLIYAPRMLRQSLTALIETEIACARAGKPCGITAKMNSLVDPGIIRLLYDASAAGVPVRLIVRGACTLRAQVPGLSEHIEVRSIVGRFLEHSRVFRFENGGAPRLFLSSADWMPRNLNRRVELMFPVEDPAAFARAQAVLDVQWADNTKAWRMLPDGRYARVAHGHPPVNAQMALLEADT